VVAAVVAAASAPDAAAADTGLRAWVVDPLTKVTPESLPPDDPASTGASPGLEARLSLARRESESFQLALRSEAPLAGVRLDTQAFDLPVEWRLVGYIKAKDKRHPDMLLPVSRFDLPAGQTCAIYVTVSTAADSRPGEHRGHLTIAADGIAPQQVALVAKVYDFVLPAGPGDCRTAFALQVGRKKWEPGEYRRYGRFMLEHRLNPDDIYRLTPPDVADLEHFHELGMNYFTVRKVAKGWSLDPIRRFFDQLTQSPRGAALRKMAYVYGYDEKPKAQWDAMGESFREVKEAFPDLRTMTTAHVYMEWEDPVATMRQYHIDAVAPWIHPGYPVYYRYEEGRKVREAGRELWAYNINFQTHHPLMQARATWWQMYHQQCDGWLYYCVNGWAKDAEAIDPDRGPFVEYESPSPNSQAELIYLGRSGPIGSLRLSTIRDGIEDWHYLHLLARKVKSVEQARQAGEPVCGEVLKWTDQPQVLYQTRDRIAGLIQADR
jgi:hypothetical protein